MILNCITRMFIKWIQKQAMINKTEFTQIYNNNKVNNNLTNNNMNK